MFNQYLSGKKTSRDLVSCIQNTRPTTLTTSHKHSALLRLSTSSHDISSATI